MHVIRRDCECIECDVTIDAAQQVQINNYFLPFLCMKFKVPAGFGYPERALRVHSCGLPSESCPCIYLNIAREIFFFLQVASRLLLRLGSRCPLSARARKTPTDGYNSETKARRDGRRSPPGPIPCFSNRTPSSSYLRGWKSSPLSAGQPHTHTHTSR